MNKFLKITILAATLMGSYLLADAQRVLYSEPESDDGKQMAFEIIGKQGGHYLVYKNIRYRHYISIFDEQMKQVDKVPMDFMPEQKIINSDFVAYADYSLFIYQFQRRSIVYCMGAKLDANGKIIGTPVELDTTVLRGTNDNKVYSMISSEDKQKICIFKINNRNRQYNQLSTVIYDPQLALQKRSRVTIPMEDKDIVFSDFHVNNEGDFVFAKCYQQSSHDFVNKVVLVKKPAATDTLFFSEMKINNHVLDEIKLKFDNINKHLIVTSFYYKQKRGNIEGMHIQVWDMNAGTALATADFPFSEDLRSQAKGDATIKTAFNDFFINKIIPKKDGGFIIATENYYTQNRGNPYNRYDWLWGNPYSNYYTNPYWDYYYYNSFNSPWSWYYYNDRSRYNSLVRHISNDIAIFSFDPSGKPQWSNVINKSQYDDNSPDFISYQTFATGGEIHFMYNSIEKRGQLILNDQSITGDGQLKRNPTWRGLSKDYELMAQFGKQVSARQMIMPCVYRNYICFAKLEL